MFIQLSTGGGHPLLININNIDYIKSTDDNHSSASTDIFFAGGNSLSVLENLDIVTKKIKEAKK